jgi:hypothetical protein
MSEENPESGYESKCFAITSAVDFLPVDPRQKALSLG